MAPNLLPYFNGEGRYLHALIALGQERVGDMSFYVGMKDITRTPTLSDSASIFVDSNEMQDDMMDIGTNSSTDHDEGEQNLDMMLSIMEEQEKLKLDVITLGNAFIEDVQERITQMDTPYLTGLKQFFSVHGNCCNYRTSSFSYSKTFITTAHLLL